MSIEQAAHPGVSVRLDCIEPAGLTIAEAAAHLQVEEATLTEVCYGRAPITAELAVRIDMAFGGNPLIWLELQADYELAEVMKRADEFRIERLWPRDDIVAAAD